MFFSFHDGKAASPTPIPYSLGARGSQEDFLEELWPGVQASGSGAFVGQGWTPLTPRMNVSPSVLGPTVMCVKL